MNNHSKNRLKTGFKLFPIFFFFILFWNVLFTYSSIFSNVQRIEIDNPNSNVKIIGNYFSPTLRNNSQLPPVLVFFTGFNAQKDFDLRPSIEFCRRGFAVFTFEVRHHGEMTGLFDENIFKDPKVIIDYIYANYQNQLDLQKFAVLGHSAGGILALSLADSRINTTVTWAAPLYFSNKIFDAVGMRFPFYNPTLNPQETINNLNSSAPINLVNTTIPRNLLLFHHINDPVVEYSQAQLIQEKTNCTLITINETAPFASQKSNHLLYDNLVISETIKWFESKLDLHLGPNLDEKYDFIFERISIELICILLLPFAIISILANELGKKFRKLTLDQEEIAINQSVSGLIPLLPEIQKKNKLWVILDLSSIIFFLTLGLSLNFLLQEWYLGFYFYIIGSTIIPITSYCIGLKKKNIKFQIRLNNPRDPSMVFLGLILGLSVIAILFVLSNSFKFMLIYPHIENLYWNIPLVLLWLGAQYIALDSFKGTYSLENVKNNPRLKKFLWILRLFLILGPYLLLFSITVNITRLQIIFIYLSVVRITSCALYWRFKSMKMILLFEFITMLFLFASI